MFFFRRDFIVHLKTHAGEPHVSSSLYLSVVAKVCTAKKSYKCDVCKKDFSQSSALNRHMRVHTGEKPYLCPVREKAFSRTSNLYTYMKIHTGEKPFSCLVCKRAFSSFSNLTRHMKTHKGNKIHTFEVHENVSSYRRALIAASKHMQRNHGFHLLKIYVHNQKHIQGKSHTVVRCVKEHFHFLVI